MNHMVKITPVPASLGHVLIEHTVQGEWYFATQKQAFTKLQEIAKHFLTEPVADFDVPSSSLVVWIKNYDLTPADRTRGMMGKFAQIQVGMGDDGFWTLVARPLPVAIWRHPQRSKRSKYPSPSNPVLKMVKAGHVFKSQEAAQDALSALHEGYPSATTPGISKMNVSMMTRDTEGNPLKQRFVLTVTPAPEGKQGFVISEKDITVKQGQKNSAVSKKKVVRVTKTTSENPLVDEPVKGYFASMIELKKKNKGMK